MLFSVLVSNCTYHWQLFFIVQPFDSISGSFPKSSNSSTVLVACYMILRVEGIPQALLCCPTASIHTREPPTDIKRAHDSFPLAIDPNTIEVYFHPTLWVIIMLRFTSLQDLLLDLCHPEFPSLHFAWTGLREKCRIMSNNPTVIQNKN